MTPIISLVSLFSDNVADIVEQKQADEMLAKRVEVKQLGALGKNLPAFQVKGKESVEFLDAKEYIKENKIQPFDEVPHE